VQGIAERVPRPMSRFWITRPSEGAIDPRMVRRRTADVENWRIPPERRDPTYASTGTLVAHRSLTDRQLSRSLYRQLCGLHEEGLNT
jgi:hypothetical protein